MVASSRRVRMVKAFTEPSDKTASIRSTLGSTTAKSSAPVLEARIGTSDGGLLVVPDDVAARLEGKSSLGRLGLLTHSTAGFIDPGFSGHVTLELANVATLPILLWPGMKIGQVSFMQMTTPADKPYGKGASGSKYQGQRGPTPSRYFENFKR